MTEHDKPARPDESTSDSPFDHTAQLLHDVTQALENGDRVTLTTLLDPLHAADQAELFNLLSSAERWSLAEALSEGFDEDILPYLSPEAADEVMEVLGVKRSAEALANLETDDAVHIIEDLPIAEQMELLEAVGTVARERLEQGLAYPEESAGRLMTKTLVTMPEYYTVGDTIDAMRKSDDLPENFYVIYVIDPRFKPVGRLLLGQIMQSKRNVPLAALMRDDVHAVHTHDDQEDVARKFRKYGLVETPVVNDSGRLVGTITVDDVVDVLHEEEGEDFMLSGGVSALDMQSSVLSTAKNRFVWLSINLITAILASVVIGNFSDTIGHLVTLAVLMPIVASMGGNAGIQAVTVAVRAIATQQINPANARRIIRRELLVGLVNGLGLGLLVGIGAQLIYKDWLLSLVFSTAMVGTLTVAGFAGVVIPILLQRYKYDPAVSSGVFLTTVTDVIGFFSFLGLASLVLIAG